MDSHNRLRGRGCSGVSARPSDAAWTAVSSLCTPTPTCTLRSYVWFRVRSVMVVAPPVGAVPRGGPRGRGAPARHQSGRARLLGLSLSAPWQKSKRRDNDTPRSNSKQRTDHRRFKVQKGRSKKVQGQATERRRAPPRTRHRVMAPDQTPKRRTPPLGPRPAATERYHDPLSVAELRYEILNTGESRSTRGTLLGRPTAGYCYSSVLVASSRCVRTGHDDTDTQSRWCGGVVGVSRYFYLCVAHVAACVIEIMSMRICVSEL